MFFRSAVLVSLATAGFAADPTVPSLNVPACPDKGTVIYKTSVPDRTAFPKTQVDLCYDSSAIHLTFTAYKETNFFYNASAMTNDEIYNFEVMEAFIYHGKQDPQHYLEIEIAPNNVTYNAFVYNPSKVRAAGAEFGHEFITDIYGYGMQTTTKLDRAKKLWTSKFRVPLGIFNIDNRTACGTDWRMNFFRTIVSPATYPNQTLGGWSPPNLASFHITPYFGHVKFV